MDRTHLEDQAARATTEERIGARRVDPRRRKIEMARLREVGKNLSEQIDEQVRKRPYVMVGAAAGIGFVAGSFLGSRLGQMLIATAIGFAAKSALEGELSPEMLRARLEKFSGGLSEE